MKTSQNSFCTKLFYSFSVYKYRKEGLTECSAKCGNAGTITDKLVCIEDGVRTVDDWYCKGVAKPHVETRPCNRRDCPPQLVLVFMLLKNILGKTLSMVRLYVLLMSR